MNQALPQPAPRFGPFALGLASVVLFWLLPFSPGLAILALRSTQHVPGWPRFLALTGACLCTGYTLLLGTMLVAVSLGWM